MARGTREKAYEAPGSCFWGFASAGNPSVGSSGWNTLQFWRSLLGLTTELNGSAMGLRRVYGYRAWHGSTDAFGTASDGQGEPRSAVFQSQFGPHPDLAHF